MNAMKEASPVAGDPLQAKFTVVSPELYAYLVAHNPAPDAVLRDLLDLGFHGAIQAGSSRERSNVPGA